MGDLVSIVLPVFNRGSVVGRAVRSLLNQTSRHWEAVIVDDGSTDQSTQVIEQYIVKDSRINLIRHPQRKGAQAARNTGIFAANGKWVAFLDSDDMWFPDSLETRLQLAMKNGLHVVHSECYVLRPEDTESRQFGVPRMQDEVYKQLLQRPGPMFQGLLVSKEALSRIGPLDETIVSYQEWDTSIRLAKHYPFGFVTEPTFLYDCRHTDTISKDSLREAKGYEQVFTKHFWSIFGLLGPKALVRHYKIAADFYFQAKDEDNAQRCLIKAFLLWPFRPRTILRGIQRVLRSGF
jgi:glycosyltransferase involved in cell wall biosynthesis